MATEQGGASSGGNGFLYFAIGALIVAVGVLGWMFYDGGWQQNRTDSAIERTADKIGDAAEDLRDSAREAARSIPPAPAPAPAQPAPVTPPAQPGNPG